MDCSMCSLPFIKFAFYKCKTISIICGPHTKTSTITSNRVWMHWKRPNTIMLTSNWPSKNTRPNGIYCARNMWNYLKIATVIWYWPSNRTYRAWLRRWKSYFGWAIVIGGIRPFFTISNTEFGCCVCVSARFQMICIECNTLLYGVQRVAEISTKIEEKLAEVFEFLRVKALQNIVLGSYPFSTQRQSCDFLNFPENSLTFPRESVFFYYQIYFCLYVP